MHKGERVAGLDHLRPVEAATTLDQKDIAMSQILQNACGGGEPDGEPLWPGSTTR